MKRVAILGGGLAALVTAFELSELNKTAKTFDITIYQQGWRLGGKGASSRNPAAAQRIEEHGLHFLFGAYHNAFRILRRTYEELTGEPDAWRSAFKPYDGPILMQDRSAGTPEPWPISCPTNDQVPGDPPLPLLMPWDYVQHLLGWLAAQRPGSAIAPAAAIRSVRSALRQRFADDLPGLRRAIRMHLRGQAAPALSELSLLPAPESVYPQLAGALAELMSREPHAQQPGDQRLLARLCLEYSRWLWRQPMRGARGARLRIFLDLACAIARGLTRDLLLKGTSNWFSLDDHDLADWLRLHGAKRETVQSALVQGLYAAVFSAGREIGAGTLLHVTLQSAFTFRGAVIFQMQMGMGEAVFAPLYQVLSARGVKFKFFHRVEELVLARDRRRIGAVVMDRQLELTVDDYEPLERIGGLLCWPNRPRVEGQVEPQQAQRLLASGCSLECYWDRWRGKQVVLQAGKDFDVLVLGISIGALPATCRQLIDDRANPAFGQMVRRVLTTQTQAVQLWFKRKEPELGWPAPVLVPYELPLDTVANMGHLLAREGWGAGGAPGALAYLCAGLDDDEPLPPREDVRYAARQRERVRQNAVRWLNGLGAHVWPGATRPGHEAEFDWDCLVDDRNREGEERLEFQHYCATIHPSDRYVLAAAGTNRYRLASNQSGYSNLYLTGDWILTALSVGCLEAATMAGIQAARAIEPSVPAAYGDWLEAGGSR